MEFKGTKGEWVINKKDDKTFISSLIEMEHICQVFTFNNIDTFEYDAKLISKAPELLEMLKVARDKFLDLKYEHDSSLKDIQWEIEQLIKEATEL